VHLDPQILSQAAQSFGIDLSSLNPLGGMDGLALAYCQADHEYVLKVNPISKDDPGQAAQLAAKSDFIYYLAKNGVRVARPVHSPGGRWVETVHAEDQDYLVTAATRAQGAHINLYDRKKAGPDFFQAWGQVTGQMHHLAKAYPWWCKHPVEIEVPSPIHDWRQEFESFRRWSGDDTEIQAKWIELGESIATLPVNRESYGLIHNDLHPHNFLVDREGQITVIDFDVCTFHFFIKDIAIALFFADWVGKPARNQSRDAYLTSFTQNFLRGYANQNDLDDFWYGELPRFIKHHQILLYIVFSHEWTRPNPWEAKTLEKWRHQILQDIPVVKILF
jgi:Ser/Thr protein kinase RdoA (MazF antagonist)